MNQQHWKDEHHTSFRLTSPISELQRYGLEKRKETGKEIKKINKQLKRWFDLDFFVFDI